MTKLALVEEAERELKAIREHRTGHRCDVATFCEYYDCRTVEKWVRAYLKAVRA